MGRTPVWVMMLMLVACAEPADPGFTPLATTTLHGTVMLVAPVADAVVCAYSFEREATSIAQSPACTTTDTDGSWTLSAGALHGSIRVEAKHGQLAYPLSAITTDIGRYARSAHISVTPVTTLATAYAHFVRQQGHTAREAIAQSQAELHHHFGGLDHASIRPWHAASVGATERTNTTEAVWTHLFNASLDHLAQRMSQEAGAAENTSITLQSLVHVLAQDIEADGFFDGRGPKGIHLKQLHLPLSGDTLRRDFAVAMNRFTESPSNATRLGAAEISPILNHLASTQAPIFREQGTPMDTVGPQLQQCTIKTEERQTSSLAQPQKGCIQLSCAWAASSDLSAGSIKFDDAAAEHALAHLQRDAQVVSVWIDTTKLSALTPDSEDAPQTFALQAVAQDRFGVVKTADLTLTVDNRPLQLVMTSMARWTSAQQPLRIAGHLDRAIRSVRVSADELIEAVEAYRFEDEVRDFSIDYPVPCNHQYDVHVTVEDWSGQTKTLHLPMACDETAPTLVLKNSFFHSDTGDSSVNLAEADWPVRFRKFYTRMDDLPDAGRGADEQNLPTFVFRVEDTSLSPVGNNPAELRVRYRYSMGFSAAYYRDWEALTPDDNGQYRLSLSYQSLLPQSILSEQPTIAASHNFIARAKPTDEHLIEFEITDAARNTRTYAYPFFLDMSGPAVELTSCVPTGSLLGGSVRPTNMAIVYTPGFYLFDAQLTYPTRLPARSLAPQARIGVAQGGHTMQTTITQVEYKLAEVRKEDYPEERMHNAWNSVYRTYSDAKCGGLRLGWEDEPCTRLKAKNRYPRSWLQPAEDRSVQGLHDVVFSPSTSETQNFDERTAYLDGDVPYYIASYATGSPVTQGDRVVKFEDVIWDDDNLPVVRLLERLGVEADESFWGGDEWWVGERRTLRGLAISPSPLSLSVVSVADGVPRPWRIKADTSCQMPVSLHW